MSYKPIWKASPKQKQIRKREGRQFWEGKGHIERDVGKERPAVRHMEEMGDVLKVSGQSVCVCVCALQLYNDLL